MTQKKEYEAIKDGVMEAFLTMQDRYDHASAKQTRYIVYDAIYNGVYDAVMESIRNGTFEKTLQEIRKGSK